MLYVGDSISKYLWINRFGSSVRYSSGAWVEQLPEGLYNVGTLQLIFSLQPQTKRSALMYVDVKLIVTTI